MLKRIANVFSLALLMMLFSVSPLFAQKDRVEGKWLSEEKTAKVEIYKAKNGKFYGKIIWLKEAVRNGKPRVDEKNPKESLRTQPLMGLVILKGFEKDDEDTYEDGTIYDPKSGKTYSSKITYENANTLLIRGYVGVSMLGKTTKWTRTE